MEPEIIAFISILVAFVALVALAVIFITWMSRHWVRRGSTSLHLDLDGSYRTGEDTWRDTVLSRDAYVMPGFRYHNFAQERKFGNGKKAEIRVYAETTPGTKCLLIHPNHAISVAEGFFSDILKGAINSGMDEQNIKRTLRRACIVWKNVGERLGLKFRVTVELCGVSTDHTTIWDSRENPDFRFLASSTAAVATALSQGSDPASNPDAGPNPGSESGSVPASNPNPGSEPDPNPNPDSNPDPAPDPNPDA